MLEFLEFGGKPGRHQQVYHPKVFRQAVVTSERVWGRDEIGMPVNRAFGSHNGIVVVNIERFPFDLSEVASESLPGLDAIKRAKEDYPK